MKRSINDKYDYTHYLDVKQGTVVHFLIVEGIITESHFREPRLNNLVVGETIVQATKNLIEIGRLRVVNIRKI